MLTPHPRVDVESLGEMLTQQYNEVEPHLSFVPVGADSWCYRTPSLWVSVRRDRQGHAPQAYEAAAELGEQGLDFILAPLRGVDHRVVHVVDNRPVVVSPVIDGTDFHASSRDEFHALADLIMRVHEATVNVALPREDFRLPFDDELEQGIAACRSGEMAKGPYATRVRDLIHDNHGHLDSARTELRALARGCRRDTAPFVLTHGEPNGNAIRARNGRLWLLDWGSAAWGPPERDWWDFTYLLPDVRVRPRFQRFYELRFILGEVAEYTARFVEDHAGDDDDQRMWNDLRRYVEMTHRPGLA